MNELNRIFLSLAALLVLNGCYSTQDDVFSRHIYFPSSEPAVVTVMTYNIRADTILDGLDNWRFRKDGVIDIIADNAADIIGLQEARYSQLQHIRHALPQYSYYGIGRTDGMQSGESCPILYRKDRFALLDSGTFWFSDTPGIPGTRDWGNILPRICSWVHLLETENDTSFYVYNLHLDVFSQNSRLKSVRLLAKKVAERKTPEPFIVMGDFNMELSNPAMMYLQKFGCDGSHPKMVNAWLSVHLSQYDVSTRQRFGGRVLGPKVDHIQISEDSRALEVMIDSRKVNGQYASDHFPVIAKILPHSRQHSAQQRTYAIRASGSD